MTSSNGPIEVTAARLIGALHMVSLILLFLGFTWTNTANARGQSSDAASATATKRAATKSAHNAVLTSRPGSPTVVNSTGPGQAGYVHYFVITGPDGEPESQVAIELSGDRVAWAFPDLGVAISPFVSSGEVTANGKTYHVEHLYGIRPFRAAGSMHALQRDVEERVSWWIDQKALFCDDDRPSDGLCVNCIGFVLRVLYPGATPGGLELPADFNGAVRGTFSTEDLLMYFAGVRVGAPRAARLRRIASLQVPDAMREELLRIAKLEPAPTAATTRVAGTRARGRAAFDSSRRASRRGS